MSSHARPLRVVVKSGSLADAVLDTATIELDLRRAPSLQDEDIVPLLDGADALISSRFTQAMGRAAGNLRLLQCTGAGTNLIDLDAVPPGATVCNASGHAAGVAEYAFMTMSALHRDLFDIDRRIRAGDWQAHRSAPQRELRGRTLAIIGLGHIGAELARIGSAFGMRVTGVTRNASPQRASTLGLDLLAPVSDLHQVLAEADFAVVALPLDETTTGYIGERELEALGPDGYLVNVARGPVVDEAALYGALRERRIAGAALDVWYRYPAGEETVLPSEFPFHELDNVIMTPHVAGWTEGTLRIRIGQIGENLERLAAGKPLATVVHPARTGLAGGLASGAEAGDGLT